MSDQQHEHKQTPDVDTRPAGLNAGRRKLVRAGLAAAPVVAAFKTDMVLAQTAGGNVAVMASSFASAATNGGSVSPNAKTTGLYIPMDQCETQQGCGDLLFGPDRCDGSGKRGCGFAPEISSKVSRKTLAQLFKMNPDNDTERLAQYLAAGFLSARKFGSESYISEQRCKEIWVKHGRWSPTAGVHWDLADTCDYFQRVYTGTGFSECLVNPSSRSREHGCGDPRGGHPHHSGRPHHRG